MGGIRVFFRPPVLGRRLSSSFRPPLARRAKDRRLRGEQYAPRLLPHDQQLKQKCHAKADLDQDLLRNPAGIG